MPVYACILECIFELVKQITKSGFRTQMSVCGRGNLVSPTTMSQELQNMDLVQVAHLQEPDYCIVVTKILSEITPDSIQNLADTSLGNPTIYFMGTSLPSTNSGTKSFRKMVKKIKGRLAITESTFPTSFIFESNFIHFVFHYGKLYSHIQPI